MHHGVLTILIFLLLFHCPHATVHLEASWLGDPSLFPQSAFTTLLFNITEAATASIEPMSVDMLLGKNARIIFPNSSIYSFSIVYITRIRCELTSPTEEMVMELLHSNLVHAVDNAGMGDLVLDYLSTETRAVDPPTWEWPDYTATLAVGGWSVTTFICVLLIIALVVSMYYPASPPPQKQLTAKAPVLRVPQFAAPPTAMIQRELHLKIPAYCAKR